MSDFWATSEETYRKVAPYIPRGKTIWEPCAGEGHLASYLRKDGHKVIATDRYYDGRDFLTWQPDEPWDLIVTNFPFSTLTKMILRAFDLGKPWVTLAPQRVLGTTTVLKRFLEADSRIEGLMPVTRFSYQPQLSRTTYQNNAMFASMWLACKVGLPKFPKKMFV